MAVAANEAIYYAAAITIMPRNSMINKKRNKPRCIIEAEEPSLPSAGGIVNFRELSPEELKQLSCKSQQIEHEKSKLDLAKNIVTIYLLGLMVCCLTVFGCNYLRIESDDAKWALNKYGDLATPLVIAIVFYYFGESKIKK